MGDCIHGFSRNGSDGVCLECYPDAPEAVFKRALQKIRKHNYQNDETNALSSDVAEALNALWDAIDERASQ